MKWDINLFFRIWLFRQSIILFLFLFISFSANHFIILLDIVKVTVFHGVQFNLNTFYLQRKISLRLRLLWSTNINYFNVCERVHVSNIIGLILRLGHVWGLIKGWIYSICDVQSKMHGICWALFSIQNLSLTFSHQKP